MVSINVPQSRASKYQSVNISPVISKESVENEMRRHYNIAREREMMMIRCMTEILSQARLKFEADKCIKMTRYETEIGNGDIAWRKAGRKVTQCLFYH